MSRVLLINVPHPAIGSRIPREQLPPLGLLSVGGPLIDDGHEVRLIDGEFGPMPLEVLVAEAIAFAPDIVMFGHSGSSSGHPVIARCAALGTAAFLLSEACALSGEIFGLGGGRVARIVLSEGEGVTLPEPSAEAVRQALPALLKDEALFHPATLAERSARVAAMLGYPESS